jgi:hypothetical protein
MRRCGWRPILALTEHVGREGGRNKKEKTKTSLPLLHVQGKKKEK